MDTSSKIKTRFEMDNIVQSLKQQGKTIVTCNGCFDILHIGHIEFLKEAKAQGDILIVAINSDSSIKANKGPSRPINNENNRANILAALRMIDYVTIFNEKTPIRLLEQIRPNVHCNGEEYGENCIEAETIRKNNGKIHLIKLKQGFSTTNIINKIRES
jgi:glycerol-3-phosphate cytidylyltransferase